VECLYLRCFVDKEKLHLYLRLLSRCLTHTVAEIQPSKPPSLLTTRCYTSSSRMARGCEMLGSHGNATGTKTLNTKFKTKEGKKGGGGGGGSGKTKQKEK
jgi:hypothetical protein